MKFSVLTAIKDGFAEFRETVPTVLHQSPAEPPFQFEWILIDDASQSPLAESFPELARDPRVKILRNETGQGQTKSLNHGIRIASGDWIVRMDGDDLCAPDRLAQLAALIASAPKADLVFSDYSVIDEKSREWAEVRMRAPLPASFFSYLCNQNNPICHPTVAFRREKKAGGLRLFREDLVNAQDYALWKEILQEGGASSFAHLAHPSVRYRIVRNSLSGARAREQEVEKKAIRSNQTLTQGQQARPILTEAQKDSMQSYRLLYYRFVGEAASAPFGADLRLLWGARHISALFLKSLFFLALRPLRRILLRKMFSGIYG